MATTRPSPSASGWALSSRLLLVVALLALAACATTAPIPARVKQEAVPVNFPELAANPDRFTGQTVILGGQIISATPTPQGTLLTVLETKTEKDERPYGADTSQGRFMAQAKGFLDPQIYAQGRQVTVAGKVAGRQAGKVGELDYTYPLIQAEQVYLWPRPEPRYYRDLYWPYGPYYYGFYGPFGPWWWGW